MEVSKLVKRPILRYHGGKWMMAPWIISHFPDHENYCEVFGGGGSVLLRKEASNIEVYNDLDDDVVNLFRVLRDAKESKRLVRGLCLTPFARTEYRAAYGDQAELDGVEKARRLVLRSYAGFGTTAYSLADNKNGFRFAPVKPYAREFRGVVTALISIVNRLKHVTIENLDALELIPKQDRPETLFYVDPPYLRSTRSISGRGYRFEIDEDYHVRLAAALHQVKGKVVLSGYASELYDRELYKGWRRETKRAIASSQKGGKARTEVIWMNF